MTYEYQFGKLKFSFSSLFYFNSFVVIEQSKNTVNLSNQSPSPKRTAYGWIKSLFAKFDYWAKQKRNHPSTLEFSFPHSSNGKNTITITYTVLTKFSDFFWIFRQQNHFRTFFVFSYCTVFKEKKRKVENKDIPSSTEMSRNV